MLLGHRLVVIRVLQAFEPVAVGGRYRWRVDDNCVEVDSATIHAGRVHVDLTDQSARPTASRLGDARPVALQIARDFLRRAGDRRSIALAEAGDADLLRRIGAMDADGNLLRAGELLFVGRSEPMVDFIVRAVPSDEAQLRLRTPELSSAPACRSGASLEVGGAFDEEWSAYVGALAPEGTDRDLEALLVLDYVSRQAWIDVETASDVLQRSRAEAAAALDRIASNVSYENAPVLVVIEETPANLDPVWTMSSGARGAIATRSDRTWAASQRRSHALDWIRRRGRLWRAELAALEGMRPESVNGVLKDLSAEKLIEPSNPSGRGRGLHYRLPSPPHEPGS